MFLSPLLKWMHLLDALLRADHPGGVHGGCPEGLLGPGAAQAGHYAVWLVPEQQDQVLTPQDYLLHLHMES